MENKRQILIYLSGKITGLSDLNKPKFAAAERLILEHAKHTEMFAYVFNPHFLPHDHDKQWGSYMRECLKALCKSNKIYVLDDWRKSKGAIVEVLVAKTLNMPLFEIDTFEPLKVSYRYLLFKLFLKL
jgi:ADP-heptose:LPS heptosyltransferase